MLRFHPIATPKAADTYYAKTDGGYYLDAASDLRTAWLGTGAAMLGLAGTPDPEQFRRLVRGLDPHTGEQLTAKLVDHRVPAWDVTASVPKGVTLALERGDARIQAAIWDAVRGTVADLEGLATTRVRKGGRQEDRPTANLVAYAVEHAETRPAKADGMPDPDRHVHVVVMNLTRDPVEEEWKAVKFRPIMDGRKFFDRRFDLRLAKNLADLGYGIETKSRADASGGRRYFSWDIAGVPPRVVQKFSRRTAEVEALAAELGIDDPAAKDKLGATSRARKRTDLTLADCRAHWDSRLTPDERRRLDAVVSAAKGGHAPKPENTLVKSVAFAVAHHFERDAVVDWHVLAATAMERCLGAARPEDIEPEAKRQGVLIKGGKATTAAVLAQEQRVIAFARDGRGTCRPMGTAHAVTAAALAGLSPDQRAVIEHVRHSPDRVILIEGDAGTGKTDAMRATVPGLDAPGVFLAPSASASRGTLREKGFTNADTIARFLADEDFREQARGGYVYVDEAPLAGLADIDAVFRHAAALDARVVLQGDRKQHKSVARGSLFEVLDRYAGCPVGRLTTNWRQRDADYKAAVNAIAGGDVAGGFDRLAALGWIKYTPETDPHAPLVADYLAVLDEGKSALVVAPTHAEGDAVTARLRAALKERGTLGADERVVERLRPLAWTEAEKGDAGRYDGAEVLQVHRRTGPFRPGERVTAADWLARGAKADPRYVSVYRREALPLAPGDLVRVTANAKDASGTHRLDNGSVYAVAGFTRDGDITLANGWVLGKDFGHLAHAYASTSHAAQGRTVDRVLIAMSRQSLPAVSAEQFYVSASRGRERATVYTDLPAGDLRAAIAKRDDRPSATELMAPPERTMAGRPRGFLERMRAVLGRLRETAGRAMEAAAANERTAHAR